MSATLTELPAPGKDERAGLYAKLAEVTAEIGALEPQGFHDFLRTKFVTEDQLMHAVRDKLASRRIMLLPSVDAVERADAKTAKGKETVVTTVRVAFTFCDGDTGATHTCEWAGTGEDPTDKGVSKALTSALRYFLLKTFLVPSTADGDPAGKPAAPPRADNQNAITAEQYDGIVAAFSAAGQPHDALHAMLDDARVPREVEGNQLSVADRVVRLSALQATKVHKSLVAMQGAAK